MECINESIDVLRYSYLGEAYDKEWALKDEAFRDVVSEGMKKGEQKSIEIARKMLSKGENIKYISEITELTIDEINSL